MTYSQKDVATIVGVSPNAIANAIKNHFLPVSIVKSGSSYVYTDYDLKIIKKHFKQTEFRRRKNV